MPRRPDSGTAVCSRVFLTVKQPLSIKIALRSRVWHDLADDCPFDPRFARVRTRTLFTP